MSNPFAGEVELVVDGEVRICRLTLGALAEMEAGLGASESLIALVERFEAGRFSARDVMAVILAGLRGGGWAVTAPELLTAQIAGGAVGAARAAGLMLARAFAEPAG